MKNIARRGLLMGAIGAGMLAALAPAMAQTKYPTKAIQIIVPSSAGGSTDLVSRMIAAYASSKWNVPVNVVNKPGGNTVPATLEVYRSPADGYTLLGDGFPTANMLDVLSPDLPYKTMDRTFLATVATGPLLLLVPSSTPYKTLTDVAEDAKKDPGSFTWASLGGFGFTDVAAKQLFYKIGVDDTKVRPVVSSGAGQAIIITAGGNVKLGLVSVASSMPYIQAGSVRPLAITSKTRIADLPNVPTTIEAGYPEVDIENHYFLSGPPGMPADVVAAWDSLMKSMAADPEVIEKWRKMGLLPLYESAADTKAYGLKQFPQLKALWAKQ